MSEANTTGDARPHGGHDGEPERLDAELQRLAQKGKQHRNNLETAADAEWRSDAYRHLRIAVGADRGSAMKRTLLALAVPAAFRATHLRPLMDEFFTWTRAARDITPGRNLATKALGYALNQEPELRQVLRSGDIPLDNTRAERALRKIVVGRKNWLFYGTDTPAEAAAAYFTIIATCRLHGIDPFVYLDEILRVLPYWPHERYLELAPQHWLTTRARLDPVELERPLSYVAVPPSRSTSSTPSTSDV